MYRHTVEQRFERPAGEARPLPRPHEQPRDHVGGREVRLQDRDQQTGRDRAQPTHLVVPVVIVPGRHAAIDRGADAEIAADRRTKVPFVVAHRGGVVPALRERGERCGSGHLAADHARTDPLADDEGGDARGIADGDDPVADQQLRKPRCRDQAEVGSVIV